MTGAEHHEPRQKAAGVREQVEQFVAGDVILLPAGFGEFQQVQVPVPAPVDDVVAAVVANLLLEPLARDAVREEMGDDAALRVDFLLEQPQQVPPLLACSQRTRAAGLGKDEQHAQRFVGRQFHRFRGRGLHVVDHADQQVAFAQRRLAGAGAGDFPRHAGQCGGEVVFLLLRPRQLDPQRALGFRLPELLEDFLPQHLLRDADADLGDRRGFLALLDVNPQIVPQVKEAVQVAGRDGLEIRLPASELPAVGVEQPELGGAVRVVGGDDQVELCGHGRNARPHFALQSECGPRHFRFRAPKPSGVRITPSSGGMQ